MPLPKRVQKGQPITADLINGIIDSIRECQINSGSGYSFSRNAGGTTISIKPQQPQIATAVADTCPFDVTASASGSDLAISVLPGLVNGVLPSNIFTTLTASSSGKKYIVVSCDSNGKNVTSASMAVETSIPTAPLATINSAPTQFKVIVAVVSGSSVYKTIPCGNILARVSPSIQENTTTYSAGARNFNIYYQWVF